MKRTNSLFLLPFLIFSLALAGCGDISISNSEPGILETDARYQIYIKAQAAGYEGTYEEWLASIKGANGTSTLNGISDPTSDIGIDGDTYINTTTWDFFVKSGGNWVNAGNIMGPKGDKGDTGEQGSAGEDGTDGKDGTSIVSITKTGSDENVDSYLITYSDGTSSTFVVTNGVDGEQGIQGIPGQNGHTPVITISEDGYWVIDGIQTDFKAQGEKGDQGEQGADGTSCRTGHGVPDNSLGVDGDSYIDIDTWDYYLKENSQWVKQGNIKGSSGQNGIDGQTPFIQDGYWWIGDTNTGIKAEGTDGLNGIDGTNGVDGQTPFIQDGYWWIGTSNTNIPATGSPGQNGSTPYIGTNGHWWIAGVDSGVLAVGVNGSNGQTPYIQEGFWWIGNQNTYVPATGAKGDQGVQGEKGDGGLSAYEIYIIYHPEYTGTEQQWISDLVNGNLREKYTVSFNSNGGTAVETQKISFGQLVTRPYDPQRTGYIFNGWYLNSELFPFNSYQVFDNLSLYARWKSSNITVTLDPNGGDVEYNTKTVTYGISYVLPTPTRENYTFDGWYLSNTELCPLSGNWAFAKDNITLVARWSGTVARVTFNVDNNVSIGSTAYVDVSFGSYFSLPVPSIITGDQFIGWALEDGALITDSEGDSIKKSSFKINVQLKAIYYVEVYTPNQLLSLNLVSSGDEALQRTYVLMNDLDFTGLSNQPISNFEGTLDGKNYRIIDLQNPLFETIGTNSSTKSATIQNLTFINLSASAIVNKVNSIATITLKNLTIHSFKKDTNDYCAFFGFVKQAGDIDNEIRPSVINLVNCHVNDEFATVECGLIYYLSFVNNINITGSSVHSNTKTAAFIYSDSFGQTVTNYEKDKIANQLTRYSNEELAFNNAIDKMNSAVKISYCSNYGDTSNLANVSAGSGYQLTHTATGNDGGYYGHKATISPRLHSFNKTVDISNCVNYGAVTGTLFKNNYQVDYYSQTVMDNKTRSYSVYYSYQRIWLSNSFTIDKCLNFGSIESFFSRKSPIYFNWSFSNVNSTTKITNCFSSGSTNTPSMGNSTYLNNYYYGPTVIIVETGAFDITNAAQINKDFFVNTIGLDASYWDLGYVNLLDEYGLPKIIY